MSFRFNVNTRFLPSAEEAEMYKNYKEDPSTLVPEDQFMMKVILNRQHKKETFFFRFRFSLQLK